MTKIIVEALEITKQRGIINKGWGGLGNLAEEKDFVYLLDNCPHDWLFSQCAAVRFPTEPVGPPHISVDEFSLQKLVDAINFMLDPKVKEQAVELVKAMENKDGVTGAVKAFFKQTPSTQKN